MLKELKVGQAVAIRKTSEFYMEGDEQNPKDMRGVVIGRGDFLPYWVRWDNGVCNTYSREDLKYWRGDAPKRRRKKAPLNMEALIQKAKKELKEHNQECTARYAFIFDGGEVEINTNTACHHTVLDYSRSPKGKTIAKIVTSLANRKGRHGESTVPYYNWLFNESPWSEAFEEKDAEKCYQEGAVVCSVDCPANVLQAGLIATRQVWEHPRVVEGFYALTQRGVKGNTAFLVSCFLTKLDGGDFTPSVHGGGHFPLNPLDIRLEGAVRFIKGELDKGKVNKSIREGGEAWGVHALFTKREGKDFFQYLLGYIKAGMKESSKSNNPFEKAKPAKTASISVGRLAELLIKEPIA